MSRKDINQRTISKAEKYSESFFNNFIVDLTKKKHPYSHLLRPNDVKTNAVNIHYPVAVRINSEHIISEKRLDMYFSFDYTISG